MKSIIITLLLSSLLLAGCRSSKSTSSRTSTTPVAQTEKPAGDAFERITANYTEWTDVNVPVNIRISQPAKFSISGRAAMVRGKSIDISLRVLGFEMGRALITSDSVFVVIKPQRTYIAESLNEVTKYVSFTTGNIQDLLMGRPFLLSKSTITATDRKLVEIEAFEQGLLINPRKQPSMANYGYAVGFEDLLMKLIIVGTQPHNFKADVSYMRHVADTGAGALASDVEIDISDGKKNYSASLNWKWNNAKWNSGISTDFSIPRGYKRILAKDLLKSALPK